MKREIKFRAWDNISLKMWDNRVVTQTALNQFIDLEHYTLMQYTGLKDKNGVEIYEGDIIQIPDDYDEYGFMAGEKREVYFLEGAYRLKPHKNRDNARGHTIEDDMEFCKVIGNIYQNPELI